MNGYLGVAIVILGWGLVFALIIWVMRREK